MPRRPESSEGREASPRAKLAPVDVEASKAALEKAREELQSKMEARLPKPEPSEDLEAALMDLREARLRLRAVAGQQPETGQLAVRHGETEARAGQDFNAFLEAVDEDMDATDMSGQRQNGPNSHL